MPRIEDLRKSLLDMSPEELREKIAAIRADRRITKDTKKTKVEKVKKASKAKTGLLQAIAGMSDEEREAFLKELEG